MEVLSEDEEQEMLAWLRDQAEKAQAMMVVYDQHMVIGHPIYFDSSRVTYSDVVSMITTTKQIDDKPPSPTRSKKLQGSVPFKEPIYNSPLRSAAAIDEEEHERRNKALWSENAKFMDRLRLKRLQREREENAAAISIQSCWKGFSIRNNYEQLKQQVTIRKKIRDGIRQVSQGTALILEDKERKRRILSRRKAAALVIQCTFRCYLAHRTAAKERTNSLREALDRNAIKIQSCFRCRKAKQAASKSASNLLSGSAENLTFVQLQQTRKALKLDRSCRLIQKVYRGHQGRRRAKGRRLLLERVSCIMIQNTMRQYMSRRAFSLLQADRMRGKRFHAAVNLQRLHRGALARRRVIILREKELQEFCEACALAIQKVFRGFLGRKFARTLDQELRTELRIRAALTIQRMYWGFACRIRARDIRRAGEEDIFVQTRLGHLERVDDLHTINMSEGMGPDNTDHRGNTILNIACRWGHLDITRKCLRWGFDINHKNGRGLTPLALAIQYGHGAVADYLITKKASLELSSDQTLIHIAAFAGMDGICSTLIAHGLSIHAKNALGRTPLVEAARGGHASTTRLLKESGANVNQGDSGGQTALHIAASLGYVDAAVALLDIGADTKAEDVFGRTAWRMAFNNQNNRVLDELSKRNRIDWHSDSFRAAEAVAAARSGILQELKKQFLNGAKPEWCDEKTGDTLLMLCAATGQPELSSFCLTQGANVDSRNVQGQTALHIACEHSQIALARLLLTHGAKILSVDKCCRTPLHIAAAKGFTFEEEIEKFGLDLNTIVDGVGMQPLHYAAQNGVTEVVKKFLQLGTQVAARDFKGRTPLHQFCSQKNSTSLDTFKALIDHGASVLDRDENGRTALHYAVMARNLGLVPSLLAIDPDLLHLQDFDGETVLFSAVRQDECAALDMLLEAGILPTIGAKNGATAISLAIADDKAQHLEKLIAYDKAGLCWSCSTAGSLLHMAVRHCATRCIRVLLGDKRHRNIINAKDNNGRTATGSAVYAGYWELYEPLSKVEDLLLLNSTEQSLIHLTCVSPSPSIQILQSLLSHTGLKEKIDDIDGSNHPATSYLAITAVKQREKEEVFAELMKLLIESGANPGKEGPDGRSSIHVCLQHGLSKVLIVMADKGLLGNRAILNAHGISTTVLEECRELGLDDVALHISAYPH